MFEKKKKPKYNYQFRTPTLPKQPINNPPAIPYIRPPVSIHRSLQQIIIDRQVQQRLNQGYTPSNAAPRPPPIVPIKPLNLKYKKYQKKK